MRFLLSTSALSLLVLCPASTARTIVVGEFEGQPIDNVFWSDGVCFAPVEGVRAGDEIEFRYSYSHNVYKLASPAAFFDCDVTDAVMVSDRADSPYTYVVTEEDVAGSESLFFACGVGGHCMGGQKLRVNLAKDVEGATESRFALGVDEARCAAAQRGEVDLFADGDDDVLASSVCSEPTSHVDEIYGVKYWSSSCVSPAFTLTPGGIINQKTVVRYPFPKDRRVVLGTRIWEFVQESEEDLIPVNLNQLYVHHILGDVVRGNGAESVRRGDEDASFAPPYGKLSGDFDNVMTFHIIDLREVGDKWLECVECRCDGGAGDTGGVQCCSNCTSLVTPTVDYRMRYNVTWSEVEDFMANQPAEDNGEPAKFLPVVSLNTDVAPALGKLVEFDVPHYTQLPENLRHPDTPTLMQIVREGNIATMFGHHSPNGRYQEGDTVHILRCLAHMHIGGVMMRLEDAITGEIVCESHATYGADPATNEGFLESLSVTDFPVDEPKVLDAQHRLRLIAIYNATEPHMGVMGLFNLDVIEGTSLKVTPDKGAKGQTFHEAVGLTVNSCPSNTCDMSQLPYLTCEDDIASMFLCTRFRLCSCEVLLASQRFPGCGESINLNGFGNGINIAVDSICAKSCGCDEQAKMDRWQEKLVMRRNAFCAYDTPDCQDFLSNLRGCSHTDTPGVEGLDSAVRDLLTDRGEDMAMEMGELGNKFMHADKEKMVTVDVACASEDEEKTFSAEGEEDSAGRSVSLHSVHVVVLLVLGILNCV